MSLRHLTAAPLKSGNLSLKFLSLQDFTELPFMNKHWLQILVAFACILNVSCNQSGSPFQKDLDFLQKYDDSLIVLSRGKSKLIVSPKYQAKVFTSTAGDGSSYGWINYKVFEAEPDPHMNAYGGENRIWLGPEGGPFSLFFPKGFLMDFANWKIPPAFDTEPWKLVYATDTNALMQKEMQLVNYSGTELFVKVDRKVTALDKPAIEQILKTTYSDEVNVVAYSTENTITNTGDKEWNDSTGMPCIWLLDMYPPSANATIIIPFKKDTTQPVNTNYFGAIPPGRLKYADSVLFFKADGKKRSKIGVPPGAAKNIAGSYDDEKKMLTITVFDIYPEGRYLNMEWDTKKPPFSGDAVNAYNDGPLEDGRRLGPFYEIESVSPAAFLAPGKSLTHKHSVFHFTGEEAVLDPICRQTLGVSLAQVKEVFKY
jgi:hypothetical protein